MSEQYGVDGPSIRGTLRSRLLINTLVDPDEVTPHLPDGVRPHVASEGTIVGCCLLDIAEVRPAPMPSLVGGRLRAVAHRFSVEWDDEFGETHIGVYVPTRHTNSRAAIFLGGRWFPGVHRPANIEFIDEQHHLEWNVRPTAQTNDYSLRLKASTDGLSDSMPSEPIGATCVGAAIGLSPDHRGELEAARMEPSHRRAQLVRLDDLHSDFLARFTTAVPAPSYLMRDVDVVWTRERAPRPSPQRVSA
jgi:hypothetical protein